MGYRDVLLDTWQLTRYNLGMQISEELTAPGAPRQLLEYIRSCPDSSIPAWCERHGIDRYKVQKVLHGKLRRIDVNFAMDVEKATGGAVPASAWAELPVTGDAA